jgi:hypothetical protein
VCERRWLPIKKAVQKKRTPFRGALFYGLAFRATPEGQVGNDSNSINGATGITAAAKHSIVQRTEADVLQEKPSIGIGSAAP